MPMTMTKEEIRLDCLRLALDCREAGQGPAEMIAFAAALESWVRDNPPPPRAKRTKVGTD